MKRDKKKRMTVQKKARKSCRRFDIYGERIQFTFKGDDAFQTSWGALVSVIIQFILILFTCVKFNKLYNRKDPDIVQFSKFVDLEDKEFKFQPGLLGFDLAVGLDTDDLDSSLGTLQIELVNKVKRTDPETGLEQQIWQKKPMEKEKCTQGENHFKGIDVSHMGSSFDTLTCLIDKDYELRGNFYSSEFQYIEISLIPCGSQFDTQGKQKCQSIQAQREYFDNRKFLLALSKSKLDLENIDQITQLTVDDSMFFYLEYDRHKQANIFIQPEEFEREDSLLQLQLFQQNILAHQECNQILKQRLLIYRSRRPQNLHYIMEPMFGMKRMRQLSDQHKEGGPIARYFIRIDDEMLVFERRIYSLFDMLGDVGGTMQVLIAFGAVIVRLFASKQFSAALIKNIYHVKKSFGMKEKQAYLSAKNNLNKSQKHKLDKIKYIDILQKSEQQKSYNFIKDQLTPGNQLNREQVDRFFKNIVNRKRFKYTVKDLFHYYLYCLCFRRKRNYKHEPQHKTNHTFMRGVKNLENEFDVLKLITAIRRVKVMMNILLTQNQRTLVKYQRKKLIETDNSNDSDQFDILKITEASRPTIRLAALSYLQAMLRRFQDKKLTEADCRLIKGVYERKVKDEVVDPYLHDINTNSNLLVKLRDAFSIELSAATVKTKPDKENYYSKKKSILNSMISAGHRKQSILKSRSQLFSKVMEQKLSESHQVKIKQDQQNLESQDANLEIIDQLFDTFSKTQSQKDTLVQKVKTKKIVPINETESEVISSGPESSIEDVIQTETNMINTDRNMNELNSIMDNYQELTNQEQQLETKRNLLLSENFTTNDQFKGQSQDKYTNKELKINSVQLNIEDI